MIPATSCAPAVPLKSRQLVFVLQSLPANAALNLKIPRSQLDAIIVLCSQGSVPKALERVTELEVTYCPLSPSKLGPLTDLIAMFPNLQSVELAFEVKWDEVQRRTSEYQYQVTLIHHKFPQIEKMDLCINSIFSNPDIVILYLSSMSETVAQYLKEFLDLEAIVDNKDEEMDDETQQELDDFLDDGEDIETEGSVIGSLLGRSIDSSPLSNVTELEEFAQEIRQCHTTQVEEDKESSPDLQGSVGLGLFRLPVHPTREKEAVEVIERYITRMRRQLKTVKIAFVQAFPQFPNEIFVWSEDRPELIELASKFSYMQHHGIRTVTYEEWNQTLSTLDSVFEVPAPSWVRIKGGLYNDDLALVERSYSTGHLDVLVIPRIRTRSKKKPPQPFLPSRWQKRSMLIKCGLHSQYVERTKVSTSIPRALSEVIPFVEYAATCGNALHFRFISQVTEDIKSRDLITVFHPFDRVSVASGTYIGMQGRLEEIFENEHAKVVLPVQPGVYQQVHIPVGQLRRLFQVGDSVRVLRGIERGRQGVVTKIDGPVLTFIDSFVLGDGENRSLPSDGSSLHNLDPGNPHRFAIEVAAYSCDVEFDDPQHRWHQQSNGPLNNPLHHNPELPTTRGQRVEVVDGSFKGTCGYASEWDDKGNLILDVYFKPSPLKPSLGRQFYNHPPRLGKLTVPHLSVRRCFVEGDLVFLKGLPSARFFVHSGLNVDENRRAAAEAEDFGTHIPLIRAHYDRQTSGWVPPSSMSRFALIHREKLAFADVVHNPEENVTSINFRVNWTVTVTSGPYKGYIGRVRRLWKNEVEVELHHKVEPF
ncbi:hypothetical protein NLI96_g13049 [Meripilus lineatus]|uniref:KOW domain-containing protein n=1 Tax=Meripilus lineatus TaxID=2056292 RepID=A0AAD5UTE4_9APHY|nr:hypothetical protein NLI96_g13049 [Physisporinus lineatus]